MRRIGFIKKLFRIDDWLWSVLPLVFAAPLFYLLFESDSLPDYLDMLRLVVFFIFTFAFLSFGYMINDYSDIEVDRACGKIKVIASMRQSTIRIVLLLLVIVGIIPMLAVSKNVLSMIGVTIATYILGAIYSISFIRAKERGIWGAIVSSFAQRGMPIIAAALLFDMSFQATASWVLLSFLNGLRYIFIHQLIDYENDKATGVTTFATMAGREPLRIAIVIILAVEVLLLIPSVIVPAFHANNTFTIAIGIVYCIIATLLTLVHYRVFGEHDILFTYSLVPLEAFLNFVVPFSFSLYLAFEEPWFYCVAAGLAVISAKALFEKCKPLMFVPALIRRVRFYE